MHGAYLPTKPTPVCTIRRSPAKIILLPDTPEEHQRRGDAADALWLELVRRVAEKT
jgi:hypothetical protein